MERGSLGASGWSWEAAGEGGRRRRSWEPRAGPSDCPGLQVASAPRQPQLILMHLLWIHGWGRGGRHSGPLPRSALRGGSLESGRLYFSDPDCRAPSSGALVRRPRVGRDTSLFFLSTGPFDMEWGFGGLSGHHPRPAPSLTGQPSWRKGAIEPPRLRGGRGNTGCGPRQSQMDPSSAAM